jgi:peroxiredoxin
VSAGRSSKVMLAAGSRAPEFNLARVNGAKQSLREILEKGPALLAFYKISCPVCQLTAPYLERLSSSAQIQVIGISQDDDGSTRGFLDRFGVTFPTLLDQSQAGYPASNAYGISSVPSLFLVERDGQVSRSFSGFSKRDLADLGAMAGVPLFQPGDDVPDWKAG